jgi:adenosylcobinamide-phosphate synthase
MTLFVLVSAVLIDWVLGEPKRWHPLVGFGKLVRWLEALMYIQQQSAAVKILSGGLAWLLLVLPSIVLTYYLVSIPQWGTAIAIVIVYLCIGHQSLYAHVHPITDALKANDLARARDLASLIVSRDKATLDIPKATIESVLENGNDAIFAALFWFVVAGVPGIVAYRLANTLDAMWGYKNPTYLYFGRIAARLDDVMNFIPARLTALTYALLGNTRNALHCWKKQAPLCESPNAGPVMSAGAGSLNIALGGAASYGGQWHQRPHLGTETKAQAIDIERALKLVSLSLWFWLFTIGVITGVSYA